MGLAVSRFLEKLCSDTGTSYVRFVCSTSPPFQFIGAVAHLREKKRCGKVAEISQRKENVLLLCVSTFVTEIGSRFAYNMHNMIFTPLHHLAFHIDQKKQSQRINTHRLQSTNLAMQQDKGIITRRHQNIIET